MMTETTDDTILYLTNACCEHAHGDAEMFDRLNLGYSTDKHDEDFYPLTDSEERYIAEDSLPVAMGQAALMGYTVLHNGQKYVMPSVELVFDPADAEDGKQALQIANEFMEKVRDRVEAVGGKVRFDDMDAVDDRYVVQVMVPMDYVETTFSGYEDWSTFVAENLLADEPATSLDQIKP